MKFSIFNIQFSTKIQTTILIAILIFVSAILRLWDIGLVPPSPDWDEAALGYNAYSILHTGADEYGKFFPVVLRSFDDYKPALYSYLIIPFLFIFGLSIQAVRMPSIIFGIATIVIVFFLNEELFHQKKLSFLIALFLAISPWHIQFSRIGFEANVGLSLNIAGAYFFLKGIKNPNFFFFSVALFCASIYVYQSEKVFVPLFLLLLVVLYWKSIIRTSKKYLVFVVIFGLILLLPMAIFLVNTPNALARAKGVSVFSNSGSIMQTTLRLQQDQKTKDIVGLLVDNRRIIYAKEVVANYFSHYDPNWLFITGDISRHHAPFMGLLYLWDLPFLLIGIYCFIFANIDKKVKMFILGWFLIAPIPASVTTGVPHAVRDLNALPTFQIFIAFGILAVINLISNLKLKYTFYGLCFLLYLFNFAYYLDQYFVQQNYYNSLDWQYGYKAAVSFITSLPSDHIVVSNEIPLDQSYMFFLFYLRYNPLLYQEQTKNSSGGFAQTHLFGKYEFRPIVWFSEKKDNKTLFVGRPQDFPPSVRILKTIYYLNGQPAMAIVKGI